MSSQAMQWAVALRIKPASEKLILMVNAYHANWKTNLVFLSQCTTTLETSLERKTVIKGYAGLEEKQLLIDTGLRKGRTRQIKVYKLNFSNPTSQNIDGNDPFKGTDSGLNTVPFFDKNHADIDRNSANFSRKDSVTGIENIQNLNKLKLEPKKKEELDDFSLPNWIPLEAWDGYIEMRKNKNNALFGRARRLIVEKLGQLRHEGCELTTVLDNSTTNGWANVYAPKINDHGRFTSYSNRNDRSGAAATMFDCNELLEMKVINEN